MSRCRELNIRNVKTRNNLNDSRHGQSCLQIKAFYYTIGNCASYDLSHKKSFWFQIRRIFGAAGHFLDGVNADHVITNSHGILPPVSFILLLIRLRPAPVLKK